MTEISIHQLAHRIQNPNREITSHGQSGTYPGTLHPSGGPTGQYIVSEAFVGGGATLAPTANQGTRGAFVPGVRIPTPSQLFTSAMEVHRSRSGAGGAPTKTTTRVAAVQSGVGAPYGIRQPSKHKMEEHARRMRQVSQMMNTTSSSPEPPTGGNPPAWRLRNPLSRIVGRCKHLMAVPPMTNENMSVLAALTTPSPAGPEDHQIHREFDHDVAKALLSVGGRFTGMDTQDLMNSPGARLLLSRNLRWFHATPDWLKLLGMVLAKKLNQHLGNITTTSFPEEEWLPPPDQATITSTPLPDPENMSLDQNAATVPMGPWMSINPLEPPTPTEVEVTREIVPEQNQPIPAEPEPEPTPKGKATKAKRTKSDTKRSSKRKEVSDSTHLDASPSAVSVQPEEGSASAEVTIHKKASTKKPSSKKKASTDGGAPPPAKKARAHSSSTSASNQDLKMMKSAQEEASPPEAPLVASEPAPFPTPAVEVNVKVEPTDAS